MSDKTSKILIFFGALFLIMLGIILYKLFDYQGYGENKANNKIKYYDVNYYTEISKLNFNNYNDVYNNIDVNLITFKNLDNNLTSSFVNDENELVSYITSYYQNIKKSNNPSKGIVYSEINKQVNGAVLSVSYKLNFEFDSDIFEDNKKIYFKTINIDLATNKVLSVDDLLSKYNYDKEYIADKIFNEDILIGDNEIVIDKETNISLTKGDLIRKKKHYINRIISDFDNIIEVYISNNSLTLIYDKKKLNDMFFENNLTTDVKERYLK